MQSAESSLLVTKRYERLGRLGAGAMGTVYRVRDRLTRAEVALKQVKVADDNADGGMWATQDDPRMALANEFQTLASLRHPHIISVLDYGFDERSRPYFTMTLLNEPQTLMEAAEDVPLTHQVKLLVQLLQALAYIHRRGIVHRDLKPSNVLVRDQQVYMLDFGLAIQSESYESDQTAGTLAYIAPEVLMGNAPTPAADLYALGVIAYEMFSGHHPYESDSTTQLITAILQTPVDVSRLDVPEALKGVLVTLMEKSPTDRYSDATRVIADLCAAVGIPVPQESVEIRESFLQAATFVGRSAELDTLKTAVAAVNTQGQGSAFLVGGESGVGKSRLITEISTRALVTGIPVLRGQMSSESGLSYELWRDIVRRLLLMVTPEADDTPVLKTMIPDLPELLGVDVPDVADTGNLQKRLMLIIEKLFRAALKQQPLLVVLEDLHWATESLLVLEYLLPLVEDLPLLLVGSYRNDERPDMPDSLPSMRVLTLSRLELSEIQQLSQSMLGTQAVSGDVVDLLQKETEGNVFFIVEVVRALAEETGSLSDIGKATLPGNVFTGGVQRIIQRRLARVPQWAQPALRLTAVAGRTADPALLRHALPDVDVERFVTVCSNAAVFDVQDEHWRFAHDKLREAVIADILPDEKPFLHRTIAEAIEAVYADYRNDYAAVLVHHWAAAGDDTKEGEYAPIAAAEMLKRNEYHEMKRLYQRAIDLKTYERAENPRKAHADLMSGIGRATYMLSEYDAVEGWRTAALEIYRDLDDTFGMAESIAGLGEIKLRRNENEAALKMVEQSRDLYEAVNAQKKVAYADMNLGIIYSQIGQQETARDYLQRCYDLMKDVGDPLDIARALNNLGVITDMLGDLDAARIYHDEALAIRREINDRHGIAYSLSNLGIITDLQGDSEEAVRLIREGLQLLRSLGETMSQSIALSALADIYIKLNRLEDAERALEECVMLRKDIKNISGVAQALNSLGRVARERGEFDSAWKHHLEALDYAEQSEQARAIRGALTDIGILLALTHKYLPAAQLLAYVEQHSTDPQPDKERVKHQESLKEILQDTVYASVVEDAAKRTQDEMIARVRSLAPQNTQSS